MINFKTCTLSLFLLLIVSAVSVKAQTPLVGIRYNNIQVAADGKSFTMEVWGYSTEPGYTTAATPWETIIIRMDLALDDPNAAIGTLTNTNTVYGLAKQVDLTSSPPGGFDPKLGIYLTRQGGGNLTAAQQLLAKVTIPIIDGTITSASVASTRQSPSSPGPNDTYWTSSVSPETRRSLSIPSDTPLPVKLADFRVQNEGNKMAQLNWETTAETNSSHFDIQRSTDTKTWQTIGTKSSANNSTSVIQYHFTDDAPLNGLSYYRLKMVDLDGTFGYSSIKNTKFEIKDQKALNLYPNPVSDVLYVNKSTANNLKMVSILTASGAPAMDVNFTSQGIPVKSLKSGVYVVKLTYGDGSSASHRIYVNR